MAAARADTRTAANPTADQIRVLEILEQLAGAADWRGVAAQERAARAVATAVCTSMPSKASWVYNTLGIAYQLLGNFSERQPGHQVPHAAPGDCKGGGRQGGGGQGVRKPWQRCKAIAYHGQHLAIAKEVGDRAGKGRAYANLGCAYQSQGDISKAIEYHAQRLATAKEVGDRAGEGRAYANLGNAYRSQGDISKAIEYHAQRLAIAKEVGDRGVRAGRTRTSGARIRRRGTSARPSSTTGRAWRGGRPSGGGQGVGEPKQRVSVAGGLCEGHRAPRAVPGDLK